MPDKIQNQENDADAGDRRSKSRRDYAIWGSYLLILVVFASAFQLGFLAPGQNLTPGVKIISPYEILPGPEHFTQLPLIPFYNATTTGATSFVVRFRLNTTSFVGGSFTSTNQADIFIIAADSSSFWPSVQRGLGEATGFTFTTGQVMSGHFNITLAAATWELVVINPSNENSTIVITEPIQAVAFCQTGPTCGP